MLGSLVHVLPHPEREPLLRRESFSGIPAAAGFSSRMVRRRAALVPWSKQKRGTGGAGQCHPRRRFCVKAVVEGATERSVSVKAVVTVKPNVGGLLPNISVSGAQDALVDLFGKTLLLELVSSELDPKTGLEKKTVQAYAHKLDSDGDQARYEAKFTVPEGFGEVGAVVVENEHHREIFLEEIALDGFLDGSVGVTCNSWVNPKSNDSQRRIFFTNKSYLPSQTPSGLKKLREKELTVLRGDGQGERRKSERVYDYDTYNDLGDPESSADLARPVLGGEERPYPRRCRTGRPRSKADPSSETKPSGGEMYVPRDESFSEVKNSTFGAKAVYSVLHAVLPSLETSLVLDDADLGFPYFTAVDKLYNEGVNVPDLLKKHSSLGNILPRLLKSITDFGRSVLQFETPELLERDRFAWFRDEEFGRQTLAGLNPYSLKLVTEWPLKSKLDPKIYGPAESGITTKMIQEEIGGVMTVDEAVEQKKLYILDYHDAFLPYVHKVRALNGTTLYGSRALFFLSRNSTLRPLAIELTRPPSPDGSKPRWRQVFTPRGDSTACWLWRFAKAHVLAHDSGYHQLVSHWLRTHCCTEPYIIATNRRLSAMHPIYRLLHPHFRYTMEINALAREALINAGGIIESSFAPGKYSLELSSAVYGQSWRFDREALPADLIHRGLAVEDPNSPHGLRLSIEDFPFANDGLVLWDIIKQWVTDYVDRYYPDPDLVASDPELQAWWTEIRTEGHADKKDEPWWPTLRAPRDLIGVLTTIIWVTSGHHAAVNFGQYHFAGYFPNRPTVARTKMPTEDPTEEEWKFFLEKPEVKLLMCFPSQVQATKVMAVLDVLSNHSPDEEYLGEKAEAAWAADPVVKAAFEAYGGRLKELEGIVDGRNADGGLLNRSGAGVVPYELLKPYSKPGVTGMGVPNSISI